MATVKLLADEELSAQAREVFDDIRAVRGTDYVNNFWRALANDPALLKRTWESIKAVMGPGALDPLTKELIYIACRRRTAAPTARIRIPPRRVPRA